jgi:hypothetical protein
MRGTRTVYELLDECAHALPEPFTRAQVLAWFRRHHPEVAESTLATQIQASTVRLGERVPTSIKRRRAPLFERVGHGAYVRLRDVDIGIQRYPMSCARVPIRVRRRPCT